MTYNEPKDNSCMISMIAKEAIIKNKAKLEKAEVETIPYCTVYFNTLTGERIGHAEMIYFYNDDTWHYSSSVGSTRIYRDKLNDDILAITNKIYKSYFPHLKVEKVMPLDMATFFEDEQQDLPEKYINK